jgi:hypothetical protein
LYGCASGLISAGGPVIQETLIMSGTFASSGWRSLLFVMIGLEFLIGATVCHADVTREEVERSIRDGIRYIKREQKADGSWRDADKDAKTGTTSLATLALLTAGEKPDSPTVARALAYLRDPAFTADNLDSTYAVALQTMVFAAADPLKDGNRIAKNVDWLQRTQIQRADQVPWAGSWSYSRFKGRPGDNSNSQYALLGLHAASEAGAVVKPEVWTLAREYWVKGQKANGSWAYTPDSGGETGSMTCAGLSSLVITGVRRYQGQEYLEGETIHDCGKGGANTNLLRGVSWMTQHFAVSQNPGSRNLWKYYYLYGLERAGRLAGIRFFGGNDWYRQGAEHLVHEQDRLGGFWQGSLNEEEHKVMTTSFALLFLAKGRAPVLINKLVHLPSGDWNNDADDIRNLVGIVSRDWKNLLTWQIVNPGDATLADLMQAPILFFNGHQMPEFSAAAKENIRQYVDQGGFILADACCDDRRFDQGFRRLMTELFPENEYKLRPLAEDHPVWRARRDLSADTYPLWGIEHGCRTVVIYSPKDLSCYWNQAERDAANPAVVKAIAVGQNIIDYATGREMPADKLTIREVRDFKQDAAKRGALRIAKLKHAGDWNVAPLAIPNLMDALRRPPLSFDVVITQKDLYPSDPNLVYYPLIYIHGRGALSFNEKDLQALRKHLDPGAGTIFADAACGSPAFDASFRKFVAELLPSNRLEPIPRTDELFTTEVGLDLKDVQYTKAAGGMRDVPQLEGVKINGHWAIIYSKYDIGCALERNAGIECKGYTHESALRIAANIVLYSRMP